jgi:hypothetical protein
LERTQARLLPCEHDHVIFTLPHELTALWQSNREWCADHLFKASAETLKELLEDERYLGAEVGLISALHTWGRTLSFPPHVHVLVTGGGLDDEQWRAVKNGYLLPVGVLKAKFRGKWLSGLNEATATGDVTLRPQTGPPSTGPRCCERSRARRGMSASRAPIGMAMASQTISRATCAAAPSRIIASSRPRLNA